MKTKPKSATSGTNRLKQAEGALRESESRFRLIFESEPECVKLLGPDGELHEMNAAGLAMIEADSFAQVENHCVYPLVVEEHRDAFRKLTDVVFRGESGVLEFEIVGLKGGRRWLETHAAPLRDSEGKITALLGITRDITERKRTEADLREAEEKYANIFENAVDGIFRTTADGRFITANPAMAAMLGYSTPEELIKAQSEEDKPTCLDPQLRS